MAKYIVISGAPTSRELRSDVPLVPHWRLIYSPEQMSQDKYMNGELSCLFLLSHQLRLL